MFSHVTVWVEELINLDQTKTVTVSLTFMSIKLVL